MNPHLFAELLNKFLADAIWFGGGLAIHGVVYFGAAVAIGAVWCFQGAQRLAGKGQRRGCPGGRMGMNQSVAQRTPAPSAAA